VLLACAGEEQAEDDLGAAGRPGRLGGEVLIRRGGGYLLRVEAGSLDVVRFEQRTEAGERALAEGRPAEAARLLTEGLGPPRPSSSSRARARN
jgi:DNA-binding SARP family transcriptional activator